MDINIMPNPTTLSSWSNLKSHHHNDMRDFCLGDDLQKPDRFKNMSLVFHDVMFDFSKQHILNSVDGILKRLKTDYIDVLLLHRPLSGREFRFDHICCRLHQQCSAKR